MLKSNKIYQGDCQMVMRDIDSDSVDCIVTDPPYGLLFMGKDWDKAVPSIEIWKECLRVLKPGAFAFVMCIPRQDCLARMICRLEDAGFNISFSSVLHTFASGFPKAASLSKQADKRADVPSLAKAFNVAGRGERKDLQNSKRALKYRADYGYKHELKTEQAKVLDGAYGGFQPKPAVEIVIVAMKPIEEKTYLDQAMTNMHGLTWLDNCRIPYKNEGDFKENWRMDKSGSKSFFNNEDKRVIAQLNNKGRFPANIICEDNVLDDGRVRKRSDHPNLVDKVYSAQQPVNFYGKETKVFCYPDMGSYSRYFNLDSWFAERIKLLPKEAQKTFPWLIVPKASKSEKNRGLEDQHGATYRTNTHSTVKPIKLMSWLVTLASREGDTVLDPFCGSGTTAIAAKMLGRQYIGIEREEEYSEIARKRLAIIPQRLDSY